MTGLGSVFEAEDDGLPKGKDLRWNVVVPPAAVGAREAQLVRVPLRLSDDDGYVVDRGRNPADEDDYIAIQVPHGEFPLMLRLRGLGANVEDGRRGDLYLRVELGDVPMRVGGGGVGLRRLASGAGVVALLLLFLAARGCT